MKYNGPKVVRDGRVAVLYSPGYGAGWYSWNKSHPELLFHPELVQMVLNGHAEDLSSSTLVAELVGDPALEGVYTGGANNLEVEWVNEGEKFKIEEYDGSERVVTEYDDEFFSV